MNLFASDLPGDTAAGDRTAAGSGQTPPPDRTPRADDRIDLDAWDAPTTPPRQPRRWLLLAAVAPWVVLVAVLTTDRQSPTPVPATGAPATGAATATPHEPTPPEQTPLSETPADDEMVATDTGVATTVLAIGGPTGPTSRGQAIGTAVLAARTWLAARPEGPAIDGLSPEPGATDRYVEHLVVESVDHPARGAVVVTLRAIVLPVEGDAYGRAEQIRLAVPVALDARGASLAGTPWRLALDDLALTPPTTTPVDDPDLLLAAAEAVTAAGYADVSLTALERTAGWAWVARVEARAPGHDAIRSHVIWLRSDVGQLVVAGAPTPPARTASPDPRSTDEEATP